MSLIFSGITARGSFKRQIIVAFVVGFFLLISAFSVYVVNHEKENLHRVSSEAAIGLARSLAVSSLSWVLADDVVGLQEVVSSFQKYPELRYAMVISPAGRVLAHSDATKVGQFVSDEPSLALTKGTSGNRIVVDDALIADVAVPVSVRGWHVGWARVGLGREKIADDLREMIVRNVFFVLSATALSLLAALLIANRLGSRISALVKVAHDVGTGNVAARASSMGGEDEITRLSNTFNQMLNALALNEDRLRAASLYTRSLIEASLDPLVTISSEGKITDVNRATETATGSTRSELIGSDFCDYFTAPEKARAGYRQVFLTGSVTDYPLALRHRDGHVTEVLYNASIYHNEAGEVLGVFAAARDITEQKRVEQVLRKSEKDLRDAQRVAHTGSWDWDARTDRITWSEEYYRIYGFDPAQPAPGYEEHLKAYTPESAARLDAAVKRNMETGEPYQLDLELVRPEGEVRWITARSETRRDALGQIIGLRGTAQDITERMQAEEQLRRSEHRLAEAQRMAHLGNWELDLRSNVLNWSDEIYRIFEIEPEKFGAFYEAFLSAIHPDDRDLVNQVYTDSVNDKKPYDIVHRLLMEDGRVKYVNEKCETYYGEDGRPLRSVGTAHDITAQKVADIALSTLKDDLENRVRVRTAELEAANKELESFSYSVSHDLRTPLRAIDGFSRILLDDYTDKLDDEGKRLLKVVRDNTSRMGQLIDDILKFSRVGRLELGFCEVDMEKLAREVFEELRPDVADAKLQLEIEPVLPASGDAAMMRQVWVNLLSNAIKFSRPRAAARIKVGSFKEGDETIYFVKDNGVGFDMRYADKLFGVFQRLHGVTEFEGTGIGLAIVKRIVTRHAGRVWAEGKVDEGATIYFALPNKEKEHG